MDSHQIHWISLAFNLPATSSDGRISELQSLEVSAKEILLHSDHH